MKCGNIEFFSRKKTHTAAILIHGYRALCEVNGEKTRPGYSLDAMLCCGPVGNLYLEQSFLPKKPERSRSSSSSCFPPGDLRSRD